MNVVITRYFRWNKMISWRTASSGFLSTENFGITIHRSPNLVPAEYVPEDETCPTSIAPIIHRSPILAPFRQIPEGRGCPTSITVLPVCVDVIVSGIHLFDTGSLCRPSIQLPSCNGSSSGTHV